MTLKSSLSLNFVVAPNDLKIQQALVSELKHLDSLAQLTPGRTFAEHQVTNETAAVTFTQAKKFQCSSK